ncbi:MAG: tRNA pseudouridine(55) synthase TruB [Gammaproteobacteria bacterium]|nr:tRNA pseudouridine(55) synthase TruB [Gammaproteobacteria bacterium]
MNPGKNNRSEAIDGVLLLNKPAGLTSNQALQRVKRLLNAKKAGHTGSLDPAATGMLPLCFGEATKVCAFLLNADKTYRVTAKLGVATDTGDADGKPTTTAGVPALSSDDWNSILQGFLGESMQVPPMYSALKKNGKRLYELARKGEQVERDPRAIRIDEIELLELADARLVFRVRCSKGTYVRSLVEDIAIKAGTVAHTARLHRENVAGFDTGAMVELPVAEALVEEGREALQDRLMPADAALTEMPAVSVNADAEARFREGQVVSTMGVASPGLVRVYGPGGEQDFLGVGEFAAGGAVAPKRVFARA